MINLLLIFALVNFASAQESSVQHIKPTAPKNCCYGDGNLEHGEVAFSLPSHCFQLVCQNGLVQQQYVQKKGDKNCCEFNDLLFSDGSDLGGYCMTMRCSKGEWKPSGKIEKCCDHCYIYNDPHIHTFDGHNYDWHGICNYSIAQTGFSTKPKLGVYGKFQDCNSQASCLSYTTFKNDPNTAVTIFDREVLKPTVNGDEFVITDSVQPLTSSSGIHPVLSWKHGDCTFLLGSSNLLLLHCRHRLDLWVHPIHSDMLNGLCGHYNQHLGDDFTRRDGTVQRPLTYWPLAFPQSWLTSEQPDGRKCNPPCLNCNDKTIPDTTNDPCKANPGDRAKYLDLCRRSLEHLRDVEGFLQYIESCAFDVCVLYQAGGEGRQIKNWLSEVQKLVTVARNITKTS